ncbi:MAG: hypothetical protein DRJ42_30300 [Deltaproteobacteria bacterium]|nr:MAG: hypothetical protein DRJ42_30300 [Deltaproteobacteria bacterium]
MLVPAFVLGGCLNPRAVDLDDKECPCAEGWVCDTSMNVCVAEGPGAADSGVGDSAAVDTGASDSAMGDTGAPADSGAMDDSGVMVPGMVKLWFEAEAATLDTEMMVGTDAMASGGEYISAASPGPDGTVPGPDGKASFEITIPFDGTYRIWGRAIASGESADSFWVCVDVDPPTAAGCSRWNTIPTMTEWGWDDVHDDADMALPPTDYVLTAGVITLDIYRREATVQLDKILVTDDLMFVPTGTGD